MNNMQSNNPLAPSSDKALHQIDVYFKNGVQNGLPNPFSALVEVQSIVVAMSGGGFLGVFTKEKSSFLLNTTEISRVEIGEQQAN